MQEELPQLSDQEFALLVAYLRKAATGDGKAVAAAVKLYPLLNELRAFAFKGTHYEIGKQGRGWWCRRATIINTETGELS